MRVGSLTLQLGASLIRIDTDDGEMLDQWRSRYESWIVADRTDISAAFSLIANPPHRAAARAIPVLRSGSAVLARGRDIRHVDASLDARLGGLLAAQHGARLMRCRWFATGDAAVAVFADTTQLVDDPTLAGDGIVELHAWAGALDDDACTIAAGLAGLTPERRLHIVGAVLAAPSPAEAAVEWASASNHGDWLGVLTELDDRGTVALTSGRPGDTRAAIHRLLRDATD